MSAESSAALIRKLAEKDARRAMIRLLSSDYDLIDAQPQNVLIEWYCQLNCWEWPDGLGVAEIPNRRGGRASNPRRTAIMAEIAKRVPERDISRYWNRDTYPGLEFDRWWRKEALNKYD